MEKKKCQQCNNTFQPKRADSVYCSKTCKQKAHYKRSVEKSNPEKVIEDTEMTTFYLDEYKSMDWSDLDFITYCFLRRNLILNATENEILSYLNAIIWDEYDWQEKYNQIRKTKAFSEYQERFLSGEIKVLPQKPTQSPPPNKESPLLF
jgi:hypothetical protein